MKKFVIVCMMLLSVMDIMAIPARKNIVKEVTLSDGTKVMAVLKGDENGHWWETASGEYLLIDDEGNATVLSNSQKSNIRQASAKRRSTSDARRMTKRKSVGASRAAIVGKKKGLVILVNFPDKTMKISSPKAFFTRQFNEEGFSDYNHIGSVRDYFYDQSYGKLAIDFDVVGPVTVSKSYSYYGQNDNYGNDKYPCTMVAEACKLVDGQVNFADYDWDSDGEVDQVYLLYAGYGENAGASANTIWPHEWNLDSGKNNNDGNGALTLDGVIVDTYAVSCELSSDSGTTPSGIGTACHEFSHCLGFPDFYDTSGNYKAWGMAAWDLMDSGSYSGPDYNGEVPSGYTSYERWCAGWLEPTELKPGMEVKAQKPLADSPEAYVLYNDNNRNEYYLLENRQPSRWFSYVEDYDAPSGLLITHVDYDEDAWYEDAPNADATHERMTPFLANSQKGKLNDYGYYIIKMQYQGHLYPYSAGDIDSLTNTSKPAATLYNANTDGTYYMNKGVYGITKYADGTIGYSCKACAPVKGDDDTPDGDYVFYESFDKCSGTGGNDNKWNGNVGNATFKSDNSGWTAIKKYGAYKCAKFGNSSNRGIVTSPSFTLNGDATLSFLAGSWMGDDETLVVYVNNEKLDSYYIPNGEWTELSADITGSGSTKLKFEGSLRFFLDEVKVTKKQTDGIKETVVATKTNGHVYSITGQDMGTEIKGLPAGIYIYNGKKYIKK